MSVLNLPSLIVAKVAGFVTMSYTASSVEARERILLARIEELQSAIDTAYEEADRRKWESTIGE